MESNSGSFLILSAKCFPGFFINLNRYNTVNFGFIAVVDIQRQNYFKIRLNKSDVSKFKKIYFSLPLT